jgi:hypothetical protein
MRGAERIHLKAGSPVSITSPGPAPGLFSFFDHRDCAKEISAAREEMIVLSRMSVYERRSAHPTHSSPDEMDDEYE